MGTTGTIMGVGNYLRTKNPQVQVVGAQPAEGAQIAGIRKWPEEYAPQIYDPTQIDAFELIGQQEAEDMARRLASHEGIFAGISSAGALIAALRVAPTVTNGNNVFIVRYLSDMIF